MYVFIYICIFLRRDKKVTMCLFTKKKVHGYGEAYSMQFSPHPQTLASDCEKTMHRREKTQDTKKLGNYAR